MGGVRKKPTCSHNFHAPYGNKRKRGRRNKVVGVITITAKAQIIWGKRERRHRGGENWKWKMQEARKMTYQLQD